MHNNIEYDRHFSQLSDTELQERQRDYRDAWRVEDFEAEKAQAVAPVNQNPTEDQAEFYPF